MRFIDIICPKCEKIIKDHIHIMGKLYPKCEPCNVYFTRAWSGFKQNVVVPYKHRSVVTGTIK